MMPNNSSLLNGWEPTIPLSETPKPVMRYDITTDLMVPVTQAHYDQVHEDSNRYLVLRTILSELMGLNFENLVKVRHEVKRQFGSVTVDG